jgi:hypothetical protein
VKDTAYKNNPGTQDDLNEIIRDAVSEIPRKELKPYLIIFIPRVRHAWGLKEVISNTL